MIDSRFDFIIIFVLIGEEVIVKFLYNFGGKKKGIFNYGLNIEFIK